MGIVVSRVLRAAAPHGPSAQLNQLLTLPANPAQTAEKGFWHNNVTGESTWKQPEALGHRSTESEEVYYIVDVRLPLPEPPRAPPPRLYYVITRSLGVAGPCNARLGILSSLLFQPSPLQPKPGTALAQIPLA